MIKKPILFLFLVALGSYAYVVLVNAYTRTHGVTSPVALLLTKPINLVKSILGKS